jgi:hypothetical protein
MLKDPEQGCKHKILFCFPWCLTIILLTILAESPYSNNSNKMPILPRCIYVGSYTVIVGLKYKFVGSVSFCLLIACWLPVL